MYRNGFWGASEHIIIIIILFYRKPRCRVSTREQCAKCFCRYRARDV